MGKLDPIVSEFETQADADAYDVWFRVQVETALASTKPRVSREDAERRIGAVLAKHRDAAADLGR